MIWLRSHDSYDTTVSLRVSLTYNGPEEAIQMVVYENGGRQTIQITIKMITVANEQKVEHIL